MLSEFFLTRCDKLKSIKMEILVTEMEKADGLKRNKWTL